MKDLILTVNVPFCMSRCSFCSKNIHVSSKATRDAYSEALLRELASVQDELSEYRLRALYFSGGTPTLLAERQLPMLAHEIQKRANLAEDFELTVATNPGCIGINVLSRLKDYRLSRIEFTLASVDRIEQDILDRHFGEEEMYVSRQILEFGQMENFSVDILRGQPGQQQANMRSLVESALAFAPPSIAMYPLRYAENTPLHRKLTFREGRTIPNVFYRKLPDREVMLESFVLAEELLVTEGLQPYTEYHYAKPAFRSLYHRLVRTGIDRIGLGLGGVTASDGLLIRNTDDLDAYIRYAGDPAHTLTEIRKLRPEEQMVEYITGRLGLLEEFSPAKCRDRFGCAPENEVMDSLAEMGLLAESAACWSLNQAGRCFAQEVFSRLGQKAISDPSHCQYNQQT